MRSAQPPPDREQQTALASGNVRPKAGIALTGDTIYYGTLSRHRSPVHSL